MSMLGRHPAPHQRRLREARAKLWLRTSAVWTNTDASIADPLVDDRQHARPRPQPQAATVHFVVPAPRRILYFQPRAVGEARVPDRLATVPLPPLVDVGREPGGGYEVRVDDLIASAAGT